MDLKSIKPVYFALVAVVIIAIAASLFWIGFMQPATSEKVNNGVSGSWEIQYLGMINGDTPEDERQAQLYAFIEHNAGAGDACEIMYFYSYSCGACMHLAPWIQEFRERYPEIQFTSYEIHEEDSYVWLEAARNEYEEEAPYVPVIFICGSILEGVEVIQTMFEPMTLAMYDLPARP